MIDLGVFTPAYNVADSLPKLIEELREVAMVLVHRKPMISLEVLIINDNSTDATKEILDEAQKTHQWLECLHNKTNLGNAANIIAGYEWASQADIAGCLDADGEHSPYAMLRHIDWLLGEQCDGVAGSIIFPDHDANYHDRNMMRFCGGMQSVAAGIDGMFYIQSPGYNLHRAEYVRTALELYKEYQTFFAEHSIDPMPRWGMHGVMIHLLSKGADAQIKAAYLECFGQSPNRTPDKLLLQANAAMTHSRMLERFLQK